MRFTQRPGGLPCLRLELVVTAHYIPHAACSVVDVGIKPALLAKVRAIARHSYGHTPPADKAGPGLIGKVGTMAAFARSDPWLAKKRALIQPHAPTFAACQRGVAVGRRMQRSHCRSEPPRRGFDRPSHVGAVVLRPPACWRHALCASRRNPGCSPWFSARGQHPRDRRKRAQKHAPADRCLCASSMRRCCRRESGVRNRREGWNGIVQ